MITMKKDMVSKLNRLCALLMLLLVVLQFLPFWSYPTEEGMARCSINGAVWFPTDHSQAIDWMRLSMGEDFRVNDIAGMPVLVLLTGMCGFFVCLSCQDRWLASLLPAACGLIAVISFLGNAAFRLSGMWILHFAVALLLSAAALVSIVYGVRHRGETI